MIKNQIKGGPKFKKDLKFKGGRGAEQSYWHKVSFFRPIIVNYSFIVTCPHHKNLPQNAA